MPIQTYDVKAIQTQLNLLGFGPLVVDGIQGQRTSAAIIAFKKSIGLRERDFIGPITWSALMGEPGDSTIPWLAEGLRVLGLHEQRDIAKLRLWLDKQVANIDPRQIPWCGAFEATIMRKWKPDIEIPKNPLLAKNWASFGKSCQPQLGCVLTFHRGQPESASGHVGNYLGESDTAYYVIGGNQTNAVTKAWKAKSSFHSARWPLDFPETGKRVRLNRNGQPLLTNAA